MADLRPQSRFVTVNDVKVHYLDWGHESAPPVVLLHGLTSLARVWEHLAKGLRDDHHVIAPDMRGHGDTPSAGSYTEAGFVADLEGFVSKLGLKKLSLLGLSLGARVGMHYAARHPQNVHRLVLAEGPFWDEKDQAQQAARLASMRDFAVPRKDAVLEKMMSMNPRFRRDILSDFLDHNLKPADGGGFTWKYDRELRGGDAAKPLLGKPLADDWDAWKKVKSPTLVIRGAESTALTAELADRLVKENPVAKLVTIAEAGHTVHVEQPDLLLKHAREWLNG